MRILVVGTGGVGGYYGARLAEAGNDVTFVARGANLEALRRKGLEVRSDFGDLKLDRVDATDAAQGPVDAAVICVKTYDNDSAARAMENAVGDGTILCSLQNGVDNELFFGERFPRATVIAATSRIVAWLEEPGVVVQRGPDVGVTLAPFDPGDMPQVQAVEEAFADTGVHVTVSQDAQAVLWMKLAGIASVGTITAYGRCTIGQAFADPRLARLMQDVCAEVDAVAKARGIALPEGACDTILAYARNMSDDFNSSMARDVEGSRPLEVESITGAVVRYGEEAGVPTPANRTILDELLPLHREAMRNRT
ncbi:MAG: ketopantoate reductase family protein [Actinomycetota bacterium]